MPQKTSFIFMTTSTLHSWLIHLISGSRSVNLPLALWRAVRGPGMWQECEKKKKLSPKHSFYWIPAPISALVSEPKTQRHTPDGWQTPTFVYSHTRTALPKKIGLSHKQAIEVLTIVIPSFSGEDTERKPQRQSHIETLISESAENKCFLIPAEEFKGFPRLVSCRGHTDKKMFSWEGKLQELTCPWQQGYRTHKNRCHGALIC